MAGVSALTVRIEGMTEAVNRFSEAMHHVGKYTDYYLATLAFLEDGGDVQSVIETERAFLGRTLSGPEVIDLLDSLT